MTVPRPGEIWRHREHGWDLRVENVADGRVIGRPWIRLGRSKRFLKLARRRKLSVPLGEFIEKPNRTVHTYGGPIRALDNIRVTARTTLAETSEEADT